MIAIARTVVKIKQRVTWKSGVLAVEQTQQNMRLSIMSANME